MGAARGMGKCSCEVHRLSALMGPARSRRWVLWGAFVVVLLVVAGLPTCSAPGPPIRTGHLSADREPSPSAEIAPAFRPVGSLPNAGGEGRVLVSTSDPSAVPNSGLRLNVTDFASNPLPSNSAYQLGAEEVIGNFEAVFGLFANPSTSAVPFFSVFTNRTNQNVHLAYWSTLSLVPGDSYDFELVHTNLTNWTLTVNGAMFAGNASAGVFDFGSPQATWLSSIGFSQVALFPSTPSLPSVVTLPLALAVLTGGGWHLPTDGTASFSGAASAQWGVEGRNQHPTLAPGEVETGSAIGNVTNGTGLWNGGPVQVRVGLTFDTPAVVATIPVVATVSVSTIGGAPLPAVSVYLHDAHQGVFLPGSPVTNGSGAANSLFRTPNVTASLLDPVTANVTLFGYVGQTIASVALSPPTQVLLSVSPTSPVLRPNGQIELDFHAVDLAGVAVPGAIVEFSASGDASLTPNSGVTDHAGGLTVNLSAGPTPSVVTITATVAGLGEWGSKQVIVEVRTGGGGPSLLAQLTPYFALLAVGVVVGLLVFLERRRRRNRPVPAMALKSYSDRLGSRPPPTGPASPGSNAPDPANRTPPSAGSP
ncbi:MAG: Ig-like domain-containing protein [Thermoplasmata archaeon]|nr:Ig-like domain-containing protein [Thermoplasmata archaeon]